MSNEISEDFKNLVGDKKKDQRSESESDSSIRQSEIKAPTVANPQKQMMDQQFMMQQQMKQQQQLQQQAAQQKAQAPVVNGAIGQVAEVKKESVVEQKSIVKTASKLAVVLALFFVFASSQSAGLLNYIPYLDTLPFSEYINLFLRALLFVILYFVLDTFVL